jgi:hypothetical protein
VYRGTHHLTLSVGITGAHVGEPPAATGRRRLTIFASKLAGCAGMHPYMDPDEMRLEFRQAVYGDAPEGYLPPPQAEARALESGMTPEATAVLERAVEAVKASADSTESAGKVAEAAALVSAMEGVSEDAKAVVRSRLFTAHGTHGEDAIRAATEADKHAVIRTDAKFRSTPLGTLPGFDVFVGGRHDGIMDDCACVTEIKNRVRRHLGVPVYERVQLHAYMSIFGVRKGLLIENFKGDRKEHDVPFDPDLWADVVANTLEFLGGVLGGVRPPTALSQGDV